jgi:predicted MFS family arabinose efflux permease
MTEASAVSTSNRSLVSAGTGVIAVTYGLIRFGYGLHLPAFAAAFHLPSAVAGGIAAGSFAGYCAAALMAQRLIAGSHARLTLWASCALAVLGTSTVAASWSSVSLGIGAVVGGSAAGAASALVAAVGASVSVPAQARAQAVVNSGTGLGVVAGGLVAFVLADQWRAIWAGFAVAGLVVTWLVDRRAVWPAAVPGQRSAGVLRGSRSLDAVRPARIAALLAGAGSAAIWTFGTDLLAATGGMAPETTAVLWCVLGGAGVIGALSGDLVRRVGVRIAWAATAAVMAVATVALAHQPGNEVFAAAALAAFGGAYVALSGVLIAYATRVMPQSAAGATAMLFIALTAGQAVGALSLGLLAESTSLATSFSAAALVLLISACLRLS